jgi:hypothetical protein
MRLHQAAQDGKGDRPNPDVHMKILPASRIEAKEAWLSKF